MMGFAGKTIAVEKDKVVYVLALISLSLFFTGVFETFGVIGTELAKHLPHSELRALGISLACISFGYMFRELAKYVNNK